MKAIENGTVGILVILALLVGGIYFVFGGEEEGTVDTSDCRTTYQQQDEIWNRIVHKYVCSYWLKSNDGKVMSGECQRVVLSGGDCIASYSYEKKPYKTCSSEYPWLAQDGTCWSGWAEGRAYAADDDSDN